MFPEKKPISTRTVVIIIIGTVFLALLAPVLLNFLLGLEVFEKYAKYQDSGQSSSGLILIAKGIVLSFILLFYRYIQDRSCGLVFLVFSVLEFAVLVAALSSVEIGRFSIYFSIFPLILMKYIADSFRSRGRRLVYATLALYAVLYFIILYYIMGSSEIFPYNIASAGGVL
jgi:hypothetical protein